MLRAQCYLLTMGFVILVLVHRGFSLQCYECTSTQDEKCGHSFEYTGTEGNKYLVECGGPTQACRKLESTDSYKGMTLVIRSCWNSTGVENLDSDFLDCKKMASIGKACYCNKPTTDGKPCNGRQPLLPCISLLTSAVLLAILRR